MQLSILTKDEIEDRLKDKYRFKVFVFTYWLGGYTEPYAPFKEVYFPIEEVDEAFVITQSEKMMNSGMFQDLFVTYENNYKRNVKINKNEVLDRFLDIADKTQYPDDPDFNEPNYDTAIKALKSISEIKGYNAPKKNVIEHVSDSRNQITQDFEEGKRIIEGVYEVLGKGKPDNLEVIRIYKQIKSRGKLESQENKSLQFKG